MDIVREKEIIEKFFFDKYANFYTICRLEMETAFIHSSIRKIFMSAHITKNSPVSRFSDKNIHTDLYHFLLNISSLYGLSFSGILEKHHLKRWINNLFCRCCPEENQKDIQQAVKVALLSLQNEAKEKKEDAHDVSNPKKTLEHSLEALTLICDKEMKDIFCPDFEDAFWTFIWNIGGKNMHKNNIEHRISQAFLQLKHEEKIKNEKRRGVHISSSP